MAKLWIESEPLNKFSDAVRTLRESLFAHISDIENPLIITSSPHRGDGCTTLTANLAGSIGQSGKRVLLIDGDLNGKGLAEYFKHESNGGFVKIIEGGDVKTVSSGIENLDILPCGIPKGNKHPFDSPRVIDLLQKYRKEYDIVIIDTAPILESSDPVVLGKHASGIILVFRAGNFQREDELVARELLERSGIKIIGAVINGVRQQDQDPYYTYQRHLEMNRK